jgi:hypothetical protein
MAEGGAIESAGPPCGQSPEPDSTSQSLSVRVEVLLSHWWMGLLLLGGAVVLPLFRQRGTPSWQTVGSEDGSVYTYQAIWHGGLRSLGLGYRGYMQLTTRLLALPTPYFSLRYLALYLSLAAVIVAASLAWCVYYLSRGWVSSRLVRVVLASFVALMPSLGPEGTASITFSIWIFLAALPWVLISLEESRRATSLRALLAFLIPTASSLSVLFLPLGLGWLAYRRTRSALIVMGAFLLGTLLQGIAVLATQQPPATPYVSAVINTVSGLRDGISARVFGVFLLGTRWEPELWRANWEAVVIAAPLLVIAMLMLLAQGAGRRAQVMAGTFTALAIIVFSVPALGRGTVSMFLIEGGFDAQINSRFSVVPVMLLASAFAILVAPTGVPNSRLASRIGRPLFVALTSLLVVVSFFALTFRSADPSWTGRVDRVWAEDCAGKPSRAVVTIPNSFLHLLPGRVPATGYAPLTVHCSNLK